MKEEISLTLASYIMGWEVQRETGASEAGEESVGAGLQRPFPIHLSNFYRDRCVNNYKGVLSVQTEVSRGGRLEESHSV